jgi:hypothetical protein
LHKSSPAYNKVFLSTVECLFIPRKLFNSRNEWVIIDIDIITHSFLGLNFMLIVTLVDKSWGSVVDIATSYRLDDQEIGV